MASSASRAGFAVLFLVGLCSVASAQQTRIRAPVFKTKTAKNGVVRYTPLKGKTPFEVVIRLYKLENDALVDLIDDDEDPWEETFEVKTPDKTEPLGPQDLLTPVPGELLLLEKLVGSLEIVIGNTEPLPDGVNLETAFFTTQVINFGKGAKTSDFEESPALPLGDVVARAGVGNVFTEPSIITGGQANTAESERTTIGGGYMNQAVLASGNYGGPAGGRGHTIGGGAYNEASGYYYNEYYGEVLAFGGYSTVSGGGGLNRYGNAIGNEATGMWSTIGGGGGNTASGQFATVGGGGSGYGSTSGNEATSSYTTVAGGRRNTASGFQSSVGGGSSNRAEGNSSTVSGGTLNSATVSNATVGGGVFNTASGYSSVVAGGTSNEATGYFSAILGGNNNSALSAYSFAGGREAIAQHQGAFVWGDSQPGAKHSVEADSFNVYARGGSRFFTDANGSVGVGVAPGSGSWSTLSDRAMKDEVTPVDSADVLARVLALPIATWRYKTQDGVRHMGPMAQDFHAAFGLGVNEKLIDQVDPDGVALAAIQGLAAQVAEKDEQLDAQQAELQAVRGELAELRALVEALSQR